MTTESEFKMVYAVRDIDRIYELALEVHKKRLIAERRMRWCPLALWVKSNDRKRKRKYMGLTASSSPEFLRSLWCDFWLNK